MSESEMVQEDDEEEAGGEGEGKEQFGDYVQHWLSIGKKEPDPFWENYASKETHNQIWLCFPPLVITCYIDLVYRS